MKEFSSSAKIAPVLGEYNEKDELYNPFEHREKKNTNSDIGALAHLLKSSLGTGILAMPHAIKNGGVVFGGIGTIIIGIICAHCVHILVRSSHVLCRRTKTPQMTYAETAEAAFLCGPKPLRPFASSSRMFVNAALCAAYVGGACVYVVFVSTSIRQLAEFYSGTSVSTRTCIFCLIPALLLLGQVRNLKYLVPFSMIANLCMVIGFSITLYYIFDGIEQTTYFKPFSSVSQLPTFFATVIFAIEGIGVVMPVENSMKKPHHFLGCPGVLNITMTIVVCFYALLGVSGYLKYGPQVQGSITLSVPTNHLSGQIVKISIALAVLFTYGLQYYVPLEVVWSMIKPRVSYKYTNVCETVMRILMVLLTVLMAWLIPNLEPFISLVGSVFFSILGISIPAVVETISCWEGHLGPFKWRLWKNAMLLVFSLFALVFGSWVAIVDIIRLYR
ncbi:hypothetical protein KM043_002395 [Ampulex compressa]|nr:hypothetical protein KM043_002395 [Ampulex compressa]